MPSNERFRNVFIMILNWQEHEVLSIISERTNICEGQGETRKLGAMMGIPKNRIGAKFQNEGKFNGLQLLS